MGFELQQIMKKYGVNTPTQIPTGGDMYGEKQFYINPAAASQVYTTPTTPTVVTPVQSGTVATPSSPLTPVAPPPASPLTPTFDSTGINTNLLPPAPVAAPPAPVAAPPAPVVAPPAPVAEPPAPAASTTPDYQQIMDNFGWGWRDEGDQSNQFTQYLQGTGDSARGLYAEGGSVHDLARKYASGGEVDETAAPEATVAPVTVAAPYANTAGIRAAQAKAEAQSQALMNMLEKQYTSPDSENARQADMYFRLASAFGSPTRTGGIMENVALAGQQMSEAAKSQREEALHQMQSRLEAQKYMTETEFQQGAMEYNSEKNRYANVLLSLYAFLNIAAVAMIVQLSRS